MWLFEAEKPKELKDRDLIQPFVPVLLMQQQGNSQKN